MLKIRLQRIGRRNDPAFRVVVTEHTKGPKSGNYLEFLGSYNPRQNTSHLNVDRIKHWLAHGAQASGTMHNLLVKEQVLTGKKINVLPRKSPLVTESEETTSASEDKATAPERPSGAASSDEGVDAPEQTAGAVQPAEAPPEEYAADSSVAAVPELAESQKNTS